MNDPRSLTVTRHVHLGQWVLAAQLIAGCSTGTPAAMSGSSTPASSRAPASAPRSSPIPASTALRAVAPTVVFHGSRTRREVALTFDSNLTPYMIHELDTHRVSSFDDVEAISELIRMHVPATFFLSGLWMQQYPQQSRALAAVPFFELGSHGYSHRAFAQHCYRLGTLPATQMAPDIDTSERVLARFTDHPTRLFRFPGGCYGSAGLRAAKTANVQVVQYDVASGDAFGTSVRRIVAHTLDSTRDGSIIVMHITGGNTAPLTPLALPKIVTGLRQRGFALVTVSQLLADDVADIAPPSSISPRAAGRRRSALQVRP